nr:retrovirus-related Pol polyprotein from transposon TNT 1-94 [Tanacetum cinerariifolium]
MRIRCKRNGSESKGTAIDESKDLTSLSLDELIGNLKVHDMVIKKHSKIVKAKGERRSLALKAKKKSSDKERPTSGSEDEVYAMAEKNQRAFVRGSWSDNGEEDVEKDKDETCLKAQASSEVCFESSNFSDENSSIDDFTLDNEYDRICLGVDLEPNEWVKDSGCSKHRTDNAEHVDNLRFNLLSVGQICDNECRVSFSKHDSEITKDGKVIGLGKTPYELLRGRKPTLDYFRVFGSKCFILNTKEYLTKFDPKSYKCVALGYSQNSKAYIILNKHTLKIEESLNVTFDETPTPYKTSPLVDDDLDEEEAFKVTEEKNLENDIEDETLEINEIVNIKESRNHP